jgi:hypothetical protein
MLGWPTVFESFWRPAAVACTIRAPPDDYSQGVLQDPAAVAALFAEDGVIELPQTNVRVQDISCWPAAPIAAANKQLQSITR